MCSDWYNHLCYMSIHTKSSSIVGYWCFIHATKTPRERNARVSLFQRSICVVYTLCRRLSQSCTILIANDTQLVIYRERKKRGLTNKDYFLLHYNISHNRRFLVASHGINEILIILIKRLISYLTEFFLEIHLMSDFKTIQKIHRVFSSLSQGTIDCK